MSENKLEPYDFRRAASGTQHMVEIVNKLDFGASLVKEGLLDNEKFKGYSERQLKELKDTMAYIYLQLQLRKIKGRQDGAFTEQGE